MLANLKAGGEEESHVLVVELETAVRDCTGISPPVVSTWCAPAVVGQHEVFRVPPGKNGLGNPQARNAPHPSGLLLEVGKHPGVVIEEAEFNKLTTVEDLLNEIAKRAAE